MTKETEKQPGKEPVDLPLGQVVSTPGALEAFQEAGVHPYFLLARHQHGDWGELDEEDWRLNDAAVEGGTLSDAARIRAFYRCQDLDYHRVGQKRHHFSAPIRILIPDLLQFPICPELRDATPEPSLRPSN